MEASWLGAVLGGRPPLRGRPAPSPPRTPDLRAVKRQASRRDATYNVNVTPQIIFGSSHAATAADLLCFSLFRFGLFVVVFSRHSHRARKVTLISLHTHNNNGCLSSATLGDNVSFQSSHPPKNLLFTSACICCQCLTKMPRQ